MFDYNISVEYKANPEQNFVIDWQQERKWAKKYASMMQRADWISLVPVSSGLPKVAVCLDHDKRWIVFSRTYPIRNTRIRLYAIGWQKTVRGQNIKSILWVYPDGTIECSDVPTLIEG